MRNVFVIVVVVFQRSIQLFQYICFCWFQHILFTCKACKRQSISYWGAPLLPLCPMLKPPWPVSCNCLEKALGGLPAFQGQSQLWRGVGEGKALAGLKPVAITTTLMVAHFKTSGLEAGHPPQSPGCRIAVFHGMMAPHALHQQAFSSPLHRHCWKYHS